MNTYIGLKKSFSFFIGAGASTIYPSNLPVANTLKLNILNLLCDKVGYKLNQNEIKLFSGFPLEFLLQVLKDISGQNIISEMLTPIKIDSQPNIIHKTIAILTKAGLCKNIYTVNFDTLLETALKKVNCSFKIYNPIPNSRKTLLPAIKNSTNQVSLFKLHGSINRSRSIFATLDKVGTPLDNFFKYSLNQSLNNEFMVFIGYKGADNDIKPILQKWLKNNPDSFLWNSRDKFGIDKDILTLINKKFLKFMDGKDFISQIYNYL